jgi:hypothetical protein
MVNFDTPSPGYVLGNSPIILLTQHPTHEDDYILNVDGSCLDVSNIVGFSAIRIHKRLSTSS